MRRSRRRDFDDCHIRIMAIQPGGLASCPCLQTFSGPNRKQWTSRNTSVSSSTRPKSRPPQPALTCLCRESACKRHLPETSHNK